MTIRDLYEWAESMNVLDLDIEIPYRDGGGYYTGCDDPSPNIEHRENSWNTEMVVTL